MSREAFPYDVFLSHSAKDKTVVRPLAERLRQDGLKVWFDEWECPSPAGAGESGQKPDEGRGAIPLAHRMGEGSWVRAAKIEEGLEHSRVLVLCMSAHALGSDWAQLPTDPQPSTNWRPAEPGVPHCLNLRSSRGKENRFP
ncbi:MAG: toll/interleukin-1 receptor domain-containing protein [Verrucomicrobia bacterium]|nr:toll/interleukin-1 receptor domain-containing protein [Verrucomicrobiota bacterium]